MAQGISSSIVNPISMYMRAVLSECPRLLTLYNNYQQLVQLIIELFYDCSKGLLHFLSNADSFIELCLHMMQVIINFSFFSLLKKQKNFQLYLYPYRLTPIVIEID